LDSENGSNPIQHTRRGDTIDSLCDDEASHSICVLDSSVNSELHRFE
jgi:hypothetical protein